jgi:hypothetical protein
MDFWKRLLITVAVMLVTSAFASLLWEQLLNFPLPSYLAGAVGGLAALPCWDILRRVRPKRDAVVTPPQ